MVDCAESIDACGAACEREIGGGSCGEAKGGIAGTERRRGGMQPDIGAARADLQMRRQCFCEWAE